MEHSTDEDKFIWTDASNSASSASESSMKNQMTDQSGGEESECHKNYKKKLHKQLFPDDDVQHSHEKLVKHKKKRKLERGTSESETNETPRKKKIKIEPESDIDTYEVKNKHKVRNGHSNVYVEQFLDELVKKEQSFLFPDEIKKKRHKSTSQANESMVNDMIKQSKVDNEDNVSTKQETSQEPVEYELSCSKKKKKKKKTDKTDNYWGTDRAESEVDHNMLLEKHEHSVDAHHDDVSYQDLTVNSTNADPDISEISKISKGNNTYNDTYNTSMLQTPAPQAKRKLSEKIQFEDDLMDLDGTQTNISTSKTDRTKLSEKLKNFTNHTKLEPCNIQYNNCSTLDEQDEVWIIKCPSHVDVCSFQDKSLNIESKCKVKLNGQTYEGNVDPSIGHTSIIVSELGRFKVKNVQINGYLYLHRRIPKVHMHEDSVMINNQTNFIPLPETKCRHPLLGAHYKKAMKLPPSVVERLKTIHSTTSKTNKETIHTPKSEKSKRQGSYDQEESVIVTTTTAKEEKKKKKKKRKHSEREVEAPSPPVPTHKKKRKKYNLEAAETWESEQAIEQNLFDY